MDLDPVDLSDPDPRLVARRLRAAARTIPGRVLHRASWEQIALAMQTRRGADVLTARLRAARTHGDLLRVLRASRSFLRPAAKASRGRASAGGSAPARVRTVGSIDAAQHLFDGRFAVAPWFVDLDHGWVEGLVNDGDDEWDEELYGEVPSSRLAVDVLPLSRLQAAIAAVCRQRLLDRREAVAPPTLGDIVGPGALAALNRRIAGSPSAVDPETRAFLVAHGLLEFLAFAESPATQHPCPSRDDRATVAEVADHGPGHR